MNKFIKKSWVYKLYKHAKMHQTWYNYFNNSKNFFCKTKNEEWLEVGEI